MKTDNQEADVLVPPSLPQMAEDGVIDKNDLVEAGGVLIVISESEHSAKGDYLTLYWNGFQIGLLYIDVDDPSSEFPWEVTVPQQMVTDGSYPLWYTRLDQAGNTAASAIVTALVQSTDTGTLPAPTFPEAIANTLSSDAVVDSNTPVKVPAYSNITEGDFVSVYWVGSDVNGNTIPDSVDTLTHTVTAAEIVDGFNVLIDAPFVTSVGKGTATAWYAVQPVSGGLPVSSVSATVNIDMTQTTLPAPLFPEGNDGWITYSEAVDGTPVKIPAYTGITAGDAVTIVWQGYQNNEPISDTQDVQLHTVVATEVETGFSIQVPSSAITPVGIGQGQAYYSVVFSNGDNGVSAAATVNVDTTHTQLLTAPVFPEATSDGVIDETEYADGTPMQISYQGMAAGDSVSLWWQGYLEDGVTPISGTAWSAIHTVLAQDIQSGNFTEIIPPEFISPIGNGYAIGHYSVTFIAGGMSESNPTEVIIMTQDTDQLYLNAATGAPFWENTSTLIKPMNTLTVSGPAGANITISLTGVAFFDENGESVWSGNLDQQGFAVLHVYSLIQGAVVVNANITDNPSVATQVDMTFGNYLPGTGALSGYAVTTGVAANGRSTASVYINTLTSSDIRIARVDITDSNASFIGYPLKVADVQLYDDGTCSVDLTDLTSESVTVTISLPEAPGSTVVTSTVFVSFPPAL